MGTRKDLAGELANAAIAELGNATDLEDFLTRLKQDPSFGVDLGPFGTLGLQRIVAEINRSPRKSEERGSLLTRLKDNYGPQSIAVYTDLLDDPNSDIQVAVAEALIKYAGSSDRVAIFKMLKSSNPEVRSDGFMAINRNAWSPDYIPAIVSALRNDHDWQVLFAALTVVKVHKVYEAKPLIEPATKNGLSIIRDDRYPVIKAI